MSKDIAALLVINIGCETVYVLEQRLQAQNIDRIKAGGILNDLVENLFNAAGVRRYLEPQSPPTVQHVRARIETLANSSVMKVTGSSMDKLYELACMMFKYQIVCATRAEQLLEVTRLHLRSVAAIINKQRDNRAATCVQLAAEMIEGHFKGRSVGELHRMRQGLLQFMQDNLVKVTLLMDSEIQERHGGTFRLPAPNSTRLGRLELYDKNGKFEKPEQLPVLAGPGMSWTGFYNFPDPLGSNMFSKDRLKLTSESSGAHVGVPIGYPGAHVGVSIGYPGMDGLHYAPSTVE